MDAAAAVRSELDRAQSDAERLRQSFDRRLRRAEAIAKGADGAELARCTKLLRESVDLLSEGRELALEIGARHDAVSAIQNRKPPPAGWVDGASEVKSTI